MPRYRVNVFVQHGDDPNYGCHVTVKTDARTEKAVIDPAIAEAVQLCKEHHPDLGEPYRVVIKQTVELKPLKESKG